MSLGWEDLENIQCSHWQLKDSDRIINKFHSFNIFRDDKLNLKIEIIYKPNNKGFSDDSFFKEPKRKEGEVYITDGYCILENIFAEHVTLNLTGITLLNKNIKTNAHETIVTITCSIADIKKSNRLKDDSEKHKFTIDWVTNLDIGRYTWSSWIHEKHEGKIAREFKSVRKTISFSEINGEISYNSKCCSIRINDLDIFFGNTECTNIDKKYNTGFILYSKNVITTLEKK